MKLPLLLVPLVSVLFSHGSGTKRNGSLEGEMWIASIQHGESAYHGNPSDYQVYRNVMDFGCAGDGIRDDTACINTAISSGGRCGENCGSATIVPALVYFPSGTYLISSPIIMFYFTQLVGNAIDRPRLVAAPNFRGMAVIDSNPYSDGGMNWYINQNNFFRQIRNFVIDSTHTPPTASTTGIHWQVAQATSLVNIHFVMTQGSMHQGIWMENGSGGFMSDLTFDGGNFGMWIGNQQFLSRNLVFNGCKTAIYLNWNWQWTFKNIHINNCGLGIDMAQVGTTKASAVGSVLLLDSTITNTPTGIKAYAHPNPWRDNSGTLLLDNLLLTNVGSIVVDPDMHVVLPGSSSIRINSWGRGSFYDSESGTGIFRQDYLPPPDKDSSLLDAQGNFFEKSRPQYENIPIEEFINVRDYGVTGDGYNDDAEALQAVINANIGKIIYLPHGAYILGRTVHIPLGSRIIGELWSLLMAGGDSYFKNSTDPRPMIQVGNPGDVGTVEITDVMFSTRGSQPGAILVKWNVKGSHPGAAGMWDSHFRVGGFAGSELQFAHCPKGQGPVPHCEAASTLLHITETGSGYFENVWAWTGDHDLDDGLAQRQISIYAARGVLVESVDGPNWLYGTQSEHNVFYQYQLSNTRNIFMTMIQSETPYWQPGPPAPQPYIPNPTFHDPTYGHCHPGSTTCPLSYGFRAHGSSNVYVYGAGLYNFFNNYDQTCLNTEDCQDAMVDLEGNSHVYFYNLNTKAAINMVVSNDSTVVAVGLENDNEFCQTINALFSGL